MVDFHVHPDFSPDAQGSIRMFCRRAVELGLEEICFTTHYEPDPERYDRERVVVGGRRQRVDSDWCDAYVRDIEEARRSFPELVVRSGVEVGYEMGVEGRVKDFVDRYGFDFVLGAIHSIEHVAMSGSKELDELRCLMQEKGTAYLMERYFDYLWAAAGSGLFDCLAHLDIYRKYIRGIAEEFGASEEYRAVIGDRCEASVRWIAERGVGIEINTAGWRRGDGEPYPDARVVRMAADLGVPHFTVGSDAHRPEDLGRDLDRAYGLLQAMGRSPARFERRRRLG